MDLRTSGELASDQERAAVDALLGPPTSGWAGGQRSVLDRHVAHGGREARSRRHLLLPVLHAVQDRVGHISRGALDYVATRLNVPPAEIYGVASFYALFALEPRSQTVLHVCDDLACGLGSAALLCGQLAAALGPEGAPADAEVGWLRSPCLGQCDRGSAVLVQRSGVAPGHLTLAPVTASQALALAHQAVVPPPPAPVAVRGAGAGEGAGRGTGPQLLARVGRVDPTSLSSYRAHGGYQGLRRAVELGPAGVIRELRDARLLGRGGAAFPTGVKWDAVASTPVRPHYVVCNADESEPGTFKDRVLMEEDPFALVEALTVAGYVTGAQRGFLYLRGEYPLAEHRLSTAIEAARTRGLLGQDVLGAGFGFDIELRRGAGAYIAGEETALFGSIEGHRAEPRNKPPFPASHGLFGKPTAVNNVETLITVLDVLRLGGPAFAGFGTEGSTGTRLFCLSGHVRAPGLYEAEFGLTLGELIELAGGLHHGRSLQAVLLGGAAGSFVGPDQLGLRLTFEDTRAAGATLGSGVVMVFDDTADMTAVVLRIARFFRDESCGQCVPCRVGTVRQEEALHRITSGAPLGGTHDELTLLDDVARVMRDASICGLGQSAANAVESALRLGLLPDGRAR